MNVEIRDEKTEIDKKKASSNMKEKNYRQFSIYVRCVERVLSQNKKETSHMRNQITEKEKVVGVEEWNKNDINFF